MSGPTCQFLPSHLTGYRASVLKCHNLPKHTDERHPSQRTDGARFPWCHLHLPPALWRIDILRWLRPQGPLTLGLASHLSALSGGSLGGIRGDFSLARRCVASSRSFL